jgi:plastocyanin
MRDSFHCPPVNHSGGTMTRVRLCPPLRSVPLAVAALIMIACAPAEDGTADTMGIDTAPVTLSPAPGEPAPATGTEPAPAAGTRTVHVVLTEWSVSPSPASFPAGPVLFHVMNQGQHTHSLEVQRGTDEWATTSIPPGGIATVTVNTTPGTYTLYCPVVDAQGNHRNRGMRTTVTVQ